MSKAKIEVWISSKTSPSNALNKGKPLYLLLMVFPSYPNIYLSLRYSKFSSLKVCSVHGIEEWRWVHCCLLWWCEFSLSPLKLKRQHKTPRSSNYKNRNNWWPIWSGGWSSHDPPLSLAPRSGNHWLNKAAGAQQHMPRAVWNIVTSVHWGLMNLVWFLFTWVQALLPSSKWKEKKNLSEKFSWNFQV